MIMQFKIIFSLAQFISEHFLSEHFLSYLQQFFIIEN